MQLESANASYDSTIALQVLESRSPVKSFIIALGEAGTTAIAVLDRIYSKFRRRNT